MKARKANQLQLKGVAIAIVATIVIMLISVPMTFETSLERIVAFIFVLIAASPGAWIVSNCIGDPDWNYHEVPSNEV